MPRLRNGNKCKTIIEGDFSLQDFANSEKVVNQRFSGLRPKKSSKSVLHNIKEQIKQSTMSTSKQDLDLEWFEKDESDFDLPLGTENEEEEDMQEAPAISHIISKKKRQRAKSETDTGIVYPTDLWSILANYIYPESISSFACLCHGSHAVVNSVHFWKRIYYRFYHTKVDLPESLTLSALDCIHGLRSRAIRMLYLTYPPFIEHTKTNLPFENDPHTLIGQRCMLMWHRKWKNVWKFFFKFHKGELTDVSSNKRRSITSPEFSRWHQDLNYNPDENCSVLEVTCQTFVPLPIVMGLYLNMVKLNMSSGGMCNQRLKLMLDSSYHHVKSRGRMDLHELVIDPVLEVRVFPWWDPGYAVTHEVLENEQ